MGPGRVACTVTNTSSSTRRQLGSRSPRIESAADHPTLGLCGISALLLNTGGCLLHNITYISSKKHSQILQISLSAKFIIQKNQTENYLPFSPKLSRTQKQCPPPPAPMRIWLPASTHPFLPRIFVTFSRRSWARGRTTTLSTTPENFMELSSEIE